MLGQEAQKNEAPKEQYPKPINLFARAQPSNPQQGKPINPFMRQNQSSNNIFHNAPRNIFAGDPKPQIKVEEKPVLPDAVKASKIKDEIEVIEQQKDGKVEKQPIKQEKKNKKKKNSGKQDKKKEEVQYVKKCECSKCKNVIIIEEEHLFCENCYGDEQHLQVVEELQYSVEELEEQLKAEKQKVAALNFQRGKYIEFEKFDNLRIELAQSRSENRRILQFYESNLSRKDQEITNLKTLLLKKEEKGRENNLKKKSKLLCQEFQERWLKIDEWVGNFEAYVSLLTRHIPSKAKQIQESIVRCQKNLVHNVEKQLFNLPIVMKKIIQEVETSKERELICLKNTSDKINKLLQDQKQEFQTQKLSLSQDTITMTRQPLSADIDRVMTYLNKLRSLAEQSQKHEISCDERQTWDILHEKETREKKLENYGQNSLLNGISE